ncbi:MAG: prepilin peptidase [Candidatus Vogelbacteria bacterium]
MVSAISLLVFLFGLIIGSFLNVAIYRYRTGYTLRGRSQCLICGKSLRWFELIPLASFIIQGGKCHTCGARISWQYPLVELATALAFWGIYRQSLFTHANLWLLILDAVIWSLLITITTYDLRHKIIPDEWVYAFAGLAMIRLVVSGADWKWGFIAGVILFGFFGGLWLISKGKWMGFGDAKFALGIGFFLGLEPSLSAMMFAFWSGALVGIAVIAIERYRHQSRLAEVPAIRAGLGREIPFAPFLALGIALVYFAHLHVVTVLTF